ncbi:GntR family transcriptional regulator [Acidaminobacter sp. JC074]|uniref:GntR family transcriptional regulator n=1 Tax=Acidaminobacter sp. JC074 TaxID=2530199 RepID=UPI001F0E0006|nr:GntR family transcriptional regulator [Acidaminobacter sp. JC074]
MTKQLAQYKKIENDILKQIQDKKYLPEDKIPTENALAKAYGVSRVTVRKATDNLVAKGYLTRVQGSGTRVANQKTLSAPSILGFETQMKQLGKKVSSEVVTYEIREANETIRSILGLSQGEKVYYVERLRKADGLIFLFEVTHISVSRFPELSLSYLSKSKFDFFHEIKDIEITHQNHTIKPFLVDENLSELFHLPVNTPINVVENKTYADDDTVVDFSVNYFHPERYELCYTRK